MVQTDLPPILARVINTFHTYGFRYASVGPDNNSWRVYVRILVRGPELVEAGKLKYVPVKKINGGSETDVGDGFEYITSENWWRCHEDFPCTSKTVGSLTIVEEAEVLKATKASPPF